MYIITHGSIYTVQVIAWRPALCQRMKGKRVKQMKKKDVLVLSEVVTHMANIQCNHFFSRNHKLKKTKEGKVNLMIARKSDFLFFIWICNGSHYKGVCLPSFPSPTSLIYLEKTKLSFSYLLQQQVVMWYSSSQKVVSRFSRENFRESIFFPFKMGHRLPACLFPLFPALNDDVKSRTMVAILC